MLRTTFITFCTLISSYHPAPVELPEAPVYADPIVIMKPVEALQPVSFTLPEEQTEMAEIPPPAPVYAPAQPTISWAGLMGGRGYALPYGNCVQEPGVNNPGWGNPIDWPVLSLTPSIGATALWTYNHTGVVVGLWDNGDIEVRHRNYGGGQTRFSPSEFRGFR